MGMTPKEEKELIKKLRKIRPSRLRRITDIRQIRIGDKVRNCRSGYPMTVTGIFTMLDDFDDPRSLSNTLYLDFDGNEGDIWEENLTDVEWDGNWLTVLWKKITR